MDKQDSNIAGAKNATLPEPLCKPFSWFAPNVPQSREASLVGIVYDICEGARTVLAVEQRNSLKVQQGEDPLLDSDATERLRLFMVAALGLLSDAAFERIEEINEASHKGEQA